MKLKGFDACSDVYTGVLGAMRNVVLVGALGLSACTPEEKMNGSEVKDMQNKVLASLTSVLFEQGLSQSGPTQILTNSNPLMASFTINVTPAAADYQAAQLNSSLKEQLEPVLQKACKPLTVEVTNVTPASDASSVEGRDSGSSQTPQTLRIQFSFDCSHPEHELHEN